MTQEPGDVLIRRSRVWTTLHRLLRARITAGLIVILPIWITFLLIKFLFEVMRDTSLWAVETYLNTSWGSALISRWGVSPEAIELKGIEAFQWRGQWVIGILCVFLTMFFLYAIGMLTANFIGKRFLAGVEVLVDRLPLVKTVYRATKQILSSVAGDQAQNFQRAVLVPYPSHETRCIGFVTGMTRDSKSGEELCAVFMPSTPNPTTGFVFILPRREVIEVTWSVEEAFSMIMSGGAMFPSTTLVKNQVARMPGSSVPVPVQS